MYDQPILGGYEQALQLSGSPKAPAYTFNGSRAGRPRVPRRRAATGTLAMQSPWAVSSDFQVARTKQANVQLEQAFGRDFTASVGFIYANGDNLPVVTDVNLGAPIGSSPTAGRSTARAASIRGSTASSKCSRSATRRSRG